MVTLLTRNRLGFDLLIRQRLKLFGVDIQIVDLTHDKAKRLRSKTTFNRTTT